MLYMYVVCARHTHTCTCKVYVCRLWQAIVDWEKAYNCCMALLGNWTGAYSLELMMYRMMCVCVCVCVCVRLHTYVHVYMLESIPVLYVHVHVHVSQNLLCVCTCTCTCIHYWAWYTCIRYWAWYTCTCTCICMFMYVRIFHLPCMMYMYYLEHEVVQESKDQRITYMYIPFVLLKIKKEWWGWAVLDKPRENPVDLCTCIYIHYYVLYMYMYIYIYLVHVELHI